MKILYDTNTQQVISNYYEAQPVGVEFANGHIELEVIPRPSELIDGVDFNSATQFVRNKETINVDLESDPEVKEYIEGWEVVDLTAEQVEERTNKAVDWVQLRRELNQSAFYPLALTQGNPNYFSVLMTTLAKEDYRWVDDLNFIMSAMCQQLFTGGFLTQPDIDALNLILSNNSVPFQVSVS